MTTITEKIIHIVLVNEQTIPRTGLRLLIERHQGLSVMGEVAHLSEVTAFASDSVDIVLLDLKSFNDQATMDSLPELMKSLGKARILLLTDEDDPEGNLRAVRLGAMGLIHKNEPAEVLLKAIERVAAGEVWINRAMMARVIDGFWNPGNIPPKTIDPETTRIAALTDREREVVGLIGEGLRNRQIAERLKISEITVRHHLTSIFDKLGVSDRFELAIYSYRHGLAKLPI
jgi:two-component system, NarL family, nitrate/nitrite response regulator NarL